MSSETSKIKEVHVRLKEQCLQYLRGNIWDISNHPAETLANYLIMVLTIMLTNRKRGIEASDKMKRYKFIRQVLFNYLRESAEPNGGFLSEKLEIDIKKIFKMLGEEFFGMIDIYPQKHDIDLWKYDSDQALDGIPFTVKR